MHVKEPRIGADEQVAEESAPLTTYWYGAERSAPELDWTDGEPTHAEPAKAVL
jgi:hypothetical protein